MSGTAFDKEIGTALDQLVPADDPVRVPSIDGSVTGPPVLVWVRTRAANGTPLAARPVSFGADGGSRRRRVTVSYRFEVLTWSVADQVPTPTALMPRIRT